MGAAVAARGAGRCRISSFRRVREPGEPRPDRRERAHEAARPQQLPPHAAAGCQKAIEPLLVYLIPMQQTVGGPITEGGIFDVLADDPGALLVAAAKETAAVVMVRRTRAFGLVIAPMHHGNPL